MYKNLLIFGIVFALLGAGIFAYSLTAESTKVCGEIMTQEVKREKVWPLILESSFMLIGIGITIHSARHVIIDRKTDLYGTEAYAVITDILDSGVRFNSRRGTGGTPMLNAYLRIISKDGNILYMTESIDENPMHLMSGDIVLVKYTDRDVNILQRVERYSLPSEIADRLEEEYRNTAGY